MLKSTLICFIFTLCALYSEAQENKPEGLEVFDQIIGLENTKLYNGKRYYHFYKPTLENHNFFLQANYQKGNVFYDGQYFMNIELKYDILYDKLIYKPMGNKSFLNIELIKNKIDSFSFQKHKFINAARIKENKGLVSGPLEVIFSSPSIKFYAKRKKTVDEKIKGIQITYLFRESDSYFLLYNNVFYAIDSRKDLRKIFPDLRKDIKKESKKNEKKFNEDDEGLYLYLIHFIAFKLNTNNA